MIRTFVRFSGFVRPYRRLLAAGMVLAVADVALGLAQPWPLKVVVDGVLRPHGGRATGSIPALLPAARSPQVLLGVAVGLLLAIAGLGAAADYCSTRLMESAGQRMANDLRDTLFAHLQRLSLRYHGQRRVGDLAARVTADVDRVQDLLVQGLSVLVPNGLLLTGMVAVMFVVDPGLAVLALAASPPMILLVHRATTDMKAASRRARRCDGEVAAAATESLGAIQVVQAFSLEEPSQRRFREVNRASLSANLEAVRHQARFSPAVDVSAALSSAVVLWFGATRVLSGRLSLGVLLVFVSYVASMYKPVRALSKLGYVLSRGVACGERVDAILSEPPDVADRPGARPAPRLAGAIAFDDVSFSYGREPVLDHVRLEVPAGAVVAVVGPTGAGKSTLVSLIPRFFDPDQGAVRIDGVDIRDYTLASLRAQVSLVLQDSVLFSGCLWDNIACGRPGATPDDVLQAARLALVDEFAERLPDGLETVVGERGVDLSGGQRQRVAIARAIVRDAPILLLDEPTSALDAASESLVVEALHNLMAGRTTVVIAHRLSTIRRADRIAVVAGGSVVEEGSHDHLLAAGGTYASLWALHARGRPAAAPVPASTGDGGWAGR